MRHHHERWDGLGYPDGLAGCAIEQGARILAVADAFDAITASRVYHGARPLPEALQELHEGAGKQFDPEVVQAMQRWVDRVAAELGKGGELTVAELLASQSSRVLAA